MEIYPAIDLKDGKCVRLLRGEFGSEHGVADDPVRVAEDCRDAGAKVIHVVDLDGARDGVRRNAGLVREIVRAAAPALVELGGGLRSMDDLREADGMGVWRFVLGSAAAENPGFAGEAAELYGDRVAVGIDAMDGFVRIRGWEEGTRLPELEFAGSMAALGVRTVIYTDITVDGTLSGPSTERIAAMRAALPGVNLVASGGVASLSDIAALRKLGVDAAITGKALYAGMLGLGEALFEGRYGQYFDKGELIPAIIRHHETGKVLMLGYMNRRAMELTLETRRATFWSRSRGEIWVKGMTSGNFLEVVSVRGDCDCDTLLLCCRPAGPVCHTGSESCFFREVADFE